MTYEYKPKTAQDVVAETAGGPTDAEAQARAEEAGVVSPAFVDYETALENYEGRSDVEPLADRRARENGTSFNDAAFRRQVDAVEDTGLGATDTLTPKQPNVLEPEVEEGKPSK